MKKLRWVNGQHLRALPESRLAELVGAQLKGARVCEDTASRFTVAAAQMVAEKVELVNDAEPLVRDALVFPLLQTLESGKAQALVDDGFAEVAGAVVDAAAKGELPDFEADDFADQYKSWLKAVGKALGRKGKQLFMPMRLALTGRLSGPDIPAQLRLVAVAQGQALVDSTPLAERISILESALAGMEASPEPAKV